MTCFFNFLDKIFGGFKNILLFCGGVRGTVLSDKANTGITHLQRRAFVYYPTTNLENSQKRVISKAAHAQDFIASICF